MTEPELWTCPVCGAPSTPGDGPYELRGDAVVKDWECTRCPAWWMAVFVYGGAQDVDLGAEDGDADC